MATVHLSPIGNGFQFLGRGGQPLLNGTLYTYQTGSSTPAATYTTLAGNVANSNPITLLADGRLANEVWLIEGQAYRFQLYDQLGVLIQTLDNIYGINDLSVNAGPLSSANVSFLQAGTGAVTRTMQKKERDIVSVLDFGAVGNGTVDDSAAIQAACTFLSANGGTLYFPPQIEGVVARYKVLTQITISSLYPVNLVSEMTGNYHDPLVGPAILIGGNITGSVFLYTAPNSGARGANGGGSVDGLCFIDPTGSGGTPGSRTLTACIEAHDFCQASIKNCRFQWINGSAILAEQMIQGWIDNNAVRYCGAVGKPAIYLKATSATFTCQAISVRGNKIEVNHLAAYLSLGANCTDIDIAGNQFEADPTNANSNQTFIDCPSSFIRITHNGFNNVNAVALTLSGVACTFVGNEVRTGAYATTSLVVSGTQNVISGNVFAGLRTAKEILLSGASNIVSGNKFYFAGSVAITGNSNTVESNSFSALTTGDAYWIYETVNTVLYTKISGNNLTNAGGTVAVGGGIYVQGTAPSVRNNTVQGLTGSAFKTDTSNSEVTDNTEVNNGNSLIGTGIASGSRIEQNGFYSAAGDPRKVTVAYGGGALAAGASVVIFFTISGAGVGGNNYATSTAFAAIGGCVYSPKVTGPNTVELVILNASLVGVVLPAANITCTVGWQ